MSNFIKFVAALLFTTVTANAQEIERIDEGRHFYSTIEVPADHDTLYVSGKGPGAVNEDAEGVARYGSTEVQARNTFMRIKEAVEKAGWSMSDIVMVRVYVVADPAMGKMDFSGFNTAYREFFGTEDQPNKPVRAVVEINGLAVDGWLVEIDVRAQRPAK